MSNATASSRDEVLIVMPARNEAERIGGLLAELRERLGDPRVVVIDDASTDDTAGVAQAFGATVLRLPFHLGYGAALQTGYKYAAERAFDFVVQMDSDGQHRPADVPGLLARVTNGECDLAIGSRFYLAAEGEAGNAEVSAVAGADSAKAGYEMGHVRSFGRRALCRLARFGGLEVSDPTSGFQAMNRRAFSLFTSPWYPYDYPDVDVLLLAHRRGLKLQEHPVEMAQSSRVSTLHSGWMPVYYAYRMMLSLWALAGVPRCDAASPDTGTA
jgi:glycosyltransferase involved in cell wall biosynthesis